MTGTEALTVVVLLVVAFFALGSVANVRKGNAFLRWLQGGLPQIGQRTTVRWIGTTSVDLGISHAKAPFEQAGVVLFLEPRDLPWLWAVSRARGRRDTFILRARLQKPPHVDLDLIDRASWSGRDAARTLKHERWNVREPEGDGSLAAYYKAGGALEKGDALLAIAKEAGMAVRRLALRRAEPHLTLHVDLPRASDAAPAFFAALREIGTKASST